MCVHACVRDKKQKGLSCICPHTIPVSTSLALKPVPFSEIWDISTDADTKQWLKPITS